MMREVGIHDDHKITSAKLQTVNIRCSMSQLSQHLAIADRALTQVPTWRLEVAISSANELIGETRQ
jgi:hypothetical protein